MYRKAAFHNLGCRVNAYETEAMKEQLLSKGYEIVPFAPGADVYVINTCTVTNIADRKSRQMLHKAREMNSSAVVVAVGCYVEDGESVLLADPAVDLIIGNHAKAQLGEILDAYWAGDRTKLYREEINQVRDYEPLEISTTEGRTRAFIKVQDGCNQFCSYCMIPYVRGRVRSRQPSDVLREAERLSRAGYSEIILTGIHLSSYGIDFTHPGENIQTGSPDDGTNELLLKLLLDTAALPGVKRLRMGSLEPGLMTEEFTAGLASAPEICPAFHLSLQSGSGRTLKRMRRKYTSGEYREICERLRRHFPDPGITTDVIAGFPGETDDEFEETAAFLREIGLSWIHVFKYSRRNGTLAARMPDQVPDHVKTERSRVLIDIANAGRYEFAKRRIGKTVEVHFEEMKPYPKEADAGQTGETGTCAYGHSREGLECLLVTEEDLSGQILTVRAEEVLKDGTLVSRY